MKIISGFLPFIFILVSIIIGISKSAKNKNENSDRYSNFGNKTNNNQINSSYNNINKSTLRQSISAVNTQSSQSSMNKSFPNFTEGRLGAEGSKSYEGLHSLNSQPKDIKSINHTHGSDDSVEKDYNLDYGSMDIKYAGEGCKEHYDKCYRSDWFDEEENRELSTIQKLIVYGDIINNPKHKEY